MKQLHFVSWVLIVILLGHTALAQDEPTLNEPKTMPGMLIVKFSDPTDALANRFANAQQKEQRTFSGNDALTEVLQTPGVYCFERALGGKSKLAQQVFCVRFDPDKVSMDALKAQLQTLPSVEYVEENAMLQGSQEQPDRPSRPDRPDRPSRPDRPGRPAEVATTNDPLLDEQYNVQITRALEAQALLTSDGTATVAVVDDAVLTTHEDLADNIFINEGEMGLDSAGTDKASNGIDDDGNGYVDDFQGYDVADEDGDPTPPDSIPLRLGSNDEPAFYHGTHVAGVAAGVTDNNTGIASVSANRVKIIPVKAVPDSVTTLSYTGINVARGITYAIDAGADVINLSLGSFFVRSSRLYRDIISMGTEQGVLIVASAGNNPGSTRGFPAALDEVMGVAGTARGDAAYFNTSFGDWVDVAAPAQDVLSTYVVPGTGQVNTAYEELTGTSFAAPFVAGLAALLKSQDPTLTPEQLRQIIRETADPIDALNPSLAGQLGAGRVNVYNAVAAVAATPGQPVADFIALATTVYVGQPVILINWSLGNGLSYRWDLTGSTTASSSQTNPTVTYLQAGRYPITLEVTSAAGSDVITKEAFVTVQPTPPVDVVGFPLVGPVSADTVPSNTQDEFANQLVYPEDRLLTSVNVSFFRLPTEASFNDFSLGVWKVNNGVTATKVYEQKLFADSLQASGIANVPSYNNIVLDQAVAITAADTFLVGISSTFDDAILHRYPSTNQTSFVNFRRVIDSSEGNQASYAWLIFPTVVAPDFLPKPPPFEERACTEEPVVLDATGLDQQFSYTWSVESNSPFEREEIPVTGELDTLVFERGDAQAYRVRLQLSSSEVEVARLDTTFRTMVEASFLDTLNVIRCDQTPRASFEVSRTTIAVGEQITYTIGDNTDAVDLEWSFPGGEPATASGDKVTVTYPTAGAYDVRLTTRNPGGGSDTLRVNSYIVVTDSACTGFTAVGLPLSGIDRVSSSSDQFGGHGPDSLQAFGNLFTVAPTQQIYGLRAFVGRVSADRPETSFVTVYVWDNDGEEGEPGTVLAQQQFSYLELEDLLAENQAARPDEFLGETPPEGGNIDLLFDEPVAIPADSSFIVGYEIEYGEVVFGGLGTEQNFWVYYNYAGESSGETSFTRLPNGNWSTYRDAGGGEINIRLSLGALVGAPQVVNQPVANIDVAPGPYAPGEPIRLSAADSSDAVTYRWEVTKIENRDGFISTQTARLTDDRFITPVGENSVDFTADAVRPEDTVTYQVTLVAVNECGLEDRATQTFIFESEEEFNPEITLSLINANTGEVLFDFSGQEEALENLIYLEDPKYQGVPLNFRAEISGDPVGSLAFFAEGLFDTQVFDNTAPYEVVGPGEGQLTEWTPPSGDYFINTVAYSLPGGLDGGGERGTSKRVRLLVYDSAMIPLELIPLCSEDPTETRWEIENFNNTDLPFEYQLDGSDEWRFGGQAALNVSTRRRIITTPTDSGAVLRIRWRNELGEFEFAEATASDEACPAEASARRANGLASGATTRVYPNPTSEAVTIELPTRQAQPVTVQVRDVLGKVHLERYQPTRGSLQLDLSDLPTGWYYVSVQSSQMGSTHRILKE